FFASTGETTTKLARMDFKINLDFLPIKALYFLFMAGFACMIPYLPVYFVYLGLDVWQIGIMRGMEPCLVFLLSPVWGAVADKFSKHKPALILALMGSSVFYCSLFFVPLISDCFTDTALTNITQGNYLISDCTVERTLTLPSSSELDPPQEQDVCSDLCQEVLDSYPVFESEENYLRCAAKSDNWECDLCGLEVYGNVSGKDQEEDGGNHGKQPAPGKQILVTVAVCETECPYLPDTANGSFDRGGSVDSFDREVCECHITTDIQTPSSMRVTYALCFLLVAISVAFNCNILAFLDAVLMQKLGVENRKDYGKHRMWGAVGFGAMAFLSGIAISVHVHHRLVQHPLRAVVYTLPRLHGLCGRRGRDPAVSAARETGDDAPRPLVAGETAEGLDVPVRHHRRGHLLRHVFLLRGHLPDPRLGGITHPARIVHPGHDDGRDTRPLHVWEDH
ncbi:putative major facilitator superfamily domain-containing protein 6, partial [Apostichopus japonicus]